jgi:hypothetical protein
MLVQLCYMNNHMCTGCRPNSTCKSLDPEYRHQALAGPLVQAKNRTRASAMGGEHSSKELFEQLINSYSEHLHELLTWLPPVHFLHERP